MTADTWVNKEDIQLFTETIEAKCPSCKSEVILNRRDDIGRLGPLSRYEIMCTECGNAFVIGGDCVNVPHELLWMESFKYKTRKRYTIALILLCQAYEMMFASGIRHILVFRVFDKSDHDINTLNSLLGQLHEAMKNHGYVNLRNCLTHLVVQESAPRTIEDSLGEIRKIKSHTSDPSDNWIQSNCTNQEMAELLVTLKKGKVNILRNDVVHCNRYFPSQEEVQDIFDESEKLFPMLSYKLGLSHSPWEMIRY